MSEITWRAAPHHHIFDAAAEYLRLHFPDVTAAKLALELERAPGEQFRAKDILRAASLPLLPADNEYVARQLAHVENGDPWNPILLVRRPWLPLLVADGYHRTCAAYWLDEDAYVTVRLAAA